MSDDETREVRQKIEALAEQIIDFRAGEKAMQAAHAEGQRKRRAEVRRAEQRADTAEQMAWFIGAVAGALLLLLIAALILPVIL